MFPAEPAVVTMSSGLSTDVRAFSPASSVPAVTTTASSAVADSRSKTCTGSYRSRSTGIRTNSKPAADIDSCRIPFSAVVKLNRPRLSVIAPSYEPSMKTFAPATGAWFLPDTVPVTGCCEKQIAERRNIGMIGFMVLIFEQSWPATTIGQKRLDRTVDLLGWIAILTKLQS